MTDTPTQTRVQIPAYTDRWMMGDRYGAIVRITKGRKNMPREAVAYVKLDRSGKTLRFILDDCTEI